MLLYIFCIGTQQLLKDVLPIDKTLQLVIALFTPPNLWLIVAIIKNGHKY